MNRKNIQKLGLIAGSGWLPKAILAHCIANSIPYVVLAIKGQTPEYIIKNHPHQFIKFATINHTFCVMHAENISHVVMAGGMHRPRLSTLRPDARGLKIIAKIGMKVGDDTLLKTLVAEIEQEGFTVLGAHELLEDLLLPTGVLTKQQPTQQQQDDIKLGFEVAKAIGQLDIGQAVLVEEGRVLAVESVAGTAAMLAAMQSYARSAVLVKCAKPQQESRADLPSLGLETVQQAHRYGVKVIAGEAGRTLLLDSMAAVKAANQYNIVLMGQ